VTSGAKPRSANKENAAVSSPGRKILMLMRIAERRKSEKLLELLAQ
jgi:hypothetical protein